MELVYTEGCMYAGLHIDGRNPNDLHLPKEKKQEIAKKLIEYLDESDLDAEIMNLIQFTGEFKHLYHCEECGDDVCEWKVKINI